MIDIFAALSAFADYDVPGYDIECDGLYYYCDYCKYPTNEGAVYEVSVAPAFPFGEEYGNQEVYKPYSGDIEIPKRINYNGIVYDVVGIGDSAFFDSSITSISVHDGIIFFADGAFAHCTSLGELSMPANLRSIGRWAVSGLLAEELVFPGNLRSIGEGAVNSCKHLKKIVFKENNGHCEMGNYAFVSLPALEEIVSYCETPYELDKDLFSGWSAEELEEFIKENGIFVDVPFETCVVKVPKGCVEAYRQSPSWSRFVNIEELADNSVESQEADIDAKTTEYFNLQGIRMESPSSGVYIRHQGDNVSKVIVK